MNKEKIRKIFGISRDKKYLLYDYNIKDNTGKCFIENTSIPVLCKFDKIVFSPIQLNLF